MEIKFTADASGDEIVLTDYGRLLDGRRGDLAPLTTLEAQRIGGVLIKSIYRQEKRPLDLPFLFKASDLSTLQDNVRTVLDVLSQGEGVLTFIKDDATERELRSCFYKYGMGEKNWRSAMETVISFDALDPYWYDPTEVEEAFTGAVPTGTFFPFFPLVLSPSSVLAEKTVTNPGVESWPIWTITGPATGVTLFNVTSDRTLALSLTMAAGETLVIDTRPLYKTVELNGANGWTYVSPYDPDLWPLAAGDNLIQVVMANTDAGSSAMLEYNPRYISL